MSRDVGPEMMKELKQAQRFNWGAFYVNTSPFMLALIIALGLFRSNPAAVIIALACPLLMLATFIPLALCFRRGLPRSQRVITFALDLLACGFFATVSWAAFRILKLGPLQH